MNEPFVWAFAPLFGLALVVMLVRQRSWHGLIAVGIAWLILSDFLLLTMAGLLVLALLTKLNWRVLAGILLQTLAVLWLGFVGKAWHWSHQSLGGHFTGWHLLLLLLGTILILAETTDTSLDPMLKLGVFIPLLHCYALAPFDWRVTLLGMGLAIGLLIWQAYRHLQAQQSLNLGWLLAFIAALLASEAGLTAVWIGLLASLMFAWQPRSVGAITLMLISCWLIQASLLAGGLPIVVALVWLIMPLAWVSLIQINQPLAWYWRFLDLALLLLILALPKIIDLLIKPVWQALGAGLTPFGRVLVQPWIGISVRNAGSQTVATLPILVLAGLFVVGVAVSYLLQRWRHDLFHTESDQLKSASLWQLLWRLTFGASSR